MPSDKKDDPKTKEPVADAADEAEDNDAAPDDDANDADEADDKAAAKASDDDDEADEKKAAAEDVDDDEAEPAPKEEPKPKPKTGVKKKKKGTKKGAAAASAPARGAAAAAPTASGIGLGKSLTLFVIVVGGLAAGFAFLGRDAPAGPPKWKTGQTVDVELTLAPTDNKDLACASTEELEGRHCAFEEKNKAWSKGPAADDKTLRPYTTINGVQFLAAGVWDQAVLKSKMPDKRFSLKCKYKVEGKVKKSAVRWHVGEQWYDQADWYSGVVSDCTIPPT